MFDPSIITYEDILAEFFRQGACGGRALSTGTHTARRPDGVRSDTHAVSSYAVTRFDAVPTSPCTATVLPVGLPRPARRRSTNQQSGRPPLCKQSRCRCRAVRGTVRVGRFDALRVASVRARVCIVVAAGHCDSAQATRICKERGAQIDIEPAKRFWDAEEYHQHYIQKQRGAR